MKYELIGAGVVFALLAILWGGYGVYVDYQYEQRIGAYMENAYEVNTPELMIKNIDLTVQGMREAELENEDYGEFVFPKPDNKMAYQYEFLENFKERAEAVVLWRELNYGTNSTSGGIEALGDVYETKMDNLREFLKEGGRADWIAHNAWYVKKHVFIYLFGDALMLLFLGGATISFALGLSMLRHW